MGDLGVNHLGDLGLCSTFLGDLGLCSTFPSLSSLDTVATALLDRGGARCQLPCEKTRRHGRGGAEQLGPESPGREAATGATGSTQHWVVWEFRERPPDWMSPVGATKIGRSNSADPVQQGDASWQCGSPEGTCGANPDHLRDTQPPKRRARSPTRTQHPGLRAHL